eukprot:Amastigsp_a678124_15.p3 type:complete len:183 gc:universal Amastigsp_a678124_15:1016-1564(+)
MCRATRTSPSCGRASPIRLSNAVVTPRSASIDTAATTEPWKTRRLARTYASHARHVMNCAPLMRASPSLALSSIGSSPCAASTAAAGSYAHEVGFHISPSPMRPKARCERGARSPDAPTVPLSGMYERQHALNARIIFSIVTRRIPECPFARTLIRRPRNIRVRCHESGAPTPAACDRIRFS